MSRSASKAASRFLRAGVASLLGACALLGALAAVASAGTAYVANDFGVAAIDTATRAVLEIDGGREIKAGAVPLAVAITPDGRFAYVVNGGSNGVSVIDTATNTVVGVPGGSEIAVGPTPVAIAITPDGRFAYVVNGGNATEPGGVSVIETATNTVVGVPGGREIAVGARPAAIAITPDGRFAYVVNGDSNGVSVIDTATNEVKTIGASTEVPVGVQPRGIAITPDGRFAYVVNRSSESVSVIDIATDQVLPLDGSRQIPVGNIPRSIAITPDGRFAYVLVRGQAVAVIDVAQNRVLEVGGAPDIPIGAPPQAIAIAPDGRFAYVANGTPTEPTAGSVSLIDTAHNSLVDLGGMTSIAVGGIAIAIAITPDQSPTASFTASAGPRATRPGMPVSFDGSASTDPDGTVATYDWNFEDGQTASLSTPGTTHSFARPGTYRVSLRVTDAEGCSSSLIFTGSTASCNGQPTAQATRTIVVAYPGVRVRCPKRARPRRCSFKLQAIRARPRHGQRPRAESLLAKARVRAGRSAVVSLKPKPAFAKRLATAKRILVKETVKIGRATRVRYARLRVVR